MLKLLKIFLTSLVILCIASWLEVPLIFFVIQIVHAESLVPFITQFCEHASAASHISQLLISSVCTMSNSLEAIHVSSHP